MVKSGVPILNSLEIISSTVGNKVIEEAFVIAREQLENMLSKIAQFYYDEVNSAAQV